VSVEGVWTPDTRTNKLPKQGAEFQFARIPYRLRNPVVRLPDDQDEFSLARSEGGVRLSVLRRGWDVSLIYYDQADKSPVFFQRRVAQPVGPDVIAFDPQHPRLHVVGATLGKSFEPVVVRAEAALSIGKRYETTDPLDPDGVVRRDTLDWLVQLEVEDGVADGLHLATGDQAFRFFSVDLRPNALCPTRREFLKPVLVVKSLFLSIDPSVAQGNIQGFLIAHCRNSGILLRYLQPHARRFFILAGEPVSPFLFRFKRQDREFSWF